MKLKQYEAKVREAIARMGWSNTTKPSVDASHFGGRTVVRAVVPEVEAENISFEVLKELSDLIGTKNINFGGEVRRGGYCETCEYSYTVLTLTAWWDNGKDGSMDDGDADAAQTELGKRDAEIVTLKARAERAEAESARLRTAIRRIADAETSVALSRHDNPSVALRRAVATAVAAAAVLAGGSNE